MEQGLYAQVFMLRQKYLKITEANKNKNEAKFKFRGQYERSQCWFDLDFDWIEENFSTREPELYRKIFKVMTIHKIQVHLKCLKFQSEIQNVWGN